MTAAWKVDAQRGLMSADSPSVFTTSMLNLFVTVGDNIGHNASHNTGKNVRQKDVPTSATFSRWVADLTEMSHLQKVIRGVYLNRLGHRNISPAAAAHWVRRRSVSSLSWVLEQGFVTNNFSDTITCVIATEVGLPNPHVGDRRTNVGTFRFFAMPARLMDERAGKFEDRQDLRFDYPRATLEKALLDWIYLAACGRSKMTRPPLDLDVAMLNHRRLSRLAKAMNLSKHLDQWINRYEAYQADDDVRENMSIKLKI